MNPTIERPTSATTPAIPSLLLDHTDLIISLDTEYTLEVHSDPPALGFSDSFCAEIKGRKVRRNKPLSYQWIVLDTATGRQAQNIICGSGIARLSLGDIIRLASQDLGYPLERFRCQAENQAPLRVLVVWHWGSAEVGLLLDRDRLMSKDEVVSLGGGVVTLQPTTLSVPIRDGHGHYGQVHLRIADTSRLVDAGTALEKLGVELKLPKIDIAPYTKDRMDIFLAEAPEHFKVYAMRDCEIALAWLLKCAHTQREVLHLKQLSPTTGSASAAGLKEYLGIKFPETFATYFSHTRQEWVPTPRRAENESYVVQAYAGGMNQSYHLGHVEGDIVDLDLAGAYAGAMGVLPGIDWTADAATEEKAPWKLTELMTFVGVKFQFPSGTQFPCLPVWTEKHGLIFPLSNREQKQCTYVTGIELHEALLMGCQVEVQSARRFKPKGLLVRDFLKYLTDLRAQYPKGTAENTAAKLACNSLYGKFGQGLAHRCSNDELFSEDEIEAGKKIKRCAVTLPHAAATITGLVRAVLGVLVREAAKIGTVLSATTDGAMIQLHPGVERDVALARLLVACESHPSVRLFLEGVRNLGLHPSKWLEVKYEGMEASTIRTRMNWIGVNGHTVHEAHSGFEKDPTESDYVHFHELEAIIQERWHCYYTEQRLNKISDVCPPPGEKARADDITTYYQRRQVNLCPDWKRRFLDNGTSRPYKNMAEFWQHRDVATRLEWDAWPDMVGYQVRHGYKGPEMLEKAVRREVMHRIALGVPGFRLPQGSTFTLACQTLAVNEKALSKLRRTRLGSANFPIRHPEVTRIKTILDLW